MENFYLLIPAICIIFITNYYNSNNNDEKKKHSYLKLFVFQIFSWVIVDDFFSKISN